MNRNLKLDNKLVFVAPYPPPIGGIAIPLKRLIPFLEKEKIDYFIFNHGTYSTEKIYANNKSLLWYLKFLFIRYNSLIHFHQTLKGLEYIYWFLYSRLNNNKIIITLHNDQISRDGFQWDLSRYLLKRTKYLKLLVVSDKVHNVLDQHEITNTYLPAYVPPKNTPQNVVPHHEELQIAFAIHRITKDNLNNVYGFDLALKLLSKSNRSYKLLMFIGDKSKSNLDFFKQTINKYGKNVNIEIFYEKNLTNYLSDIDILLRPNRRDGYGVSLQEALEFKVIPIASNVCQRPKGTILFETESGKDFEEKFNKICSLSIEEKQILFKDLKPLEHHLKLIDLYKKLLNNDNQKSN